MLVITRRLGEKILIGDDICITLVSTERGKCKIGIEAPRNVVVTRTELLTAQQQAEIEHKCKGNK